MSPSIEHRVDIIEVDGEVEQVYNHLIYHWAAEDVTARAYLDEVETVSILTGEPTPAILDYLRERYVRLQRLGRDGYSVLKD